MTALLEARRDELEGPCGRFGGTRLEVLGSSARGEGFGPGSDLDFIVHFRPAPMGLVEQYLGFKEALEALFGVEVDPIEEEAATNPFFLRSIQADRTLLYAA